ncbi:unnamed protein product [Arctia plantaginis]|uniref:Uncharacterized protein n=1 Tax=Arctia plantaginis TaxID=874455 RepID=A0A8S1ALA3_ARCPL|nr:unnamed protein product [Arctia plantaginis]
MNTLKSLFVLLGFIYHTYSYSTVPCKKICILNNRKCVTSGGYDVYKTVVNGVKGLNAPLDPLHIEKIEGVLENVKYKLTNITLKGLKGCTVTKLKLNVTSTKYGQYLHCPKLISHFRFEAQGNTKKPVLRGKGTATVAAYNYDILNYGLYSVFVNDDHRPHFFIVTQHSKTNLKGKLEFAITNAHLIDTNKVNETVKYMNDRWRGTEKFLHAPIVQKAMTILVYSIDKYSHKRTMGELLPEKKHQHYEKF